MTATVSLDSQFDILDRELPADVACDLSDEPALAWSRRDRAVELGGSVTRAFIDALPADWRGEDVRIQVKVTHLEAGALAGPAGFHCDWIDVTRAAHGPAEWPRAVAAVVGFAPTRFACGRIELPAVPGQPEQIAAWDGPIAKALERGELRERTVPLGRLFRFGPASLHARCPAPRGGWRAILRALRDPDGRWLVDWNCRWDDMRQRVARGEAAPRP